MYKTIGITGCGVIDPVLKSWLLVNTKHTVKIYNPAKGYLNNIDNCDIYFIQIHIPTEKKGKQNLKTLKGIIAKLSSYKPVFIRTPILPGTTEKLRREFHKDIYFIPEFLTERTADKDFNTQPMVFTGQIKLLKNIFTNKKFIQMSSIEAEIAKYTHNVFGALKIIYFNTIYKICSKFNADFKNIKEATLLSGYISQAHTQVPRPDGLFGYGDKCFPKDTQAFLHQNKHRALGKLLKPVVKINKKFRKNKI